jgi:hypothetical protein
VDEQASTVAPRGELADAGIHQPRR